MQTPRAMLILLTLFAPVRMMAGDTPGDAKVRRIAEAYRKAVVAGDTIAIAATYRADAVEMPPFHPRLLGRSAIEEYYKAFCSGSLKITDFTFANVTSEVSGKIGYVTGTYHQTLSAKSGDSRDDSGSFLVIVKRDAKGWKSAYVMYNSDRAPSITGSPAAFASPVPGVLNYFVALGYEFASWFGLALGISGLLVALTWLTRRVRKRLRTPEGQWSEATA